MMGFGEREGIPTLVLGLFLGEDWRCCLSFDSMYCTSNIDMHAASRCLQDRSKRHG
jgi:hypothetical protein